MYNLKIGRHNYIVNYVEQHHEALDGSYKGRCYSEQKKIFVAIELPETEQELVLIHEAFHAILYTSGGYEYLIEKGLTRDNIETLIKIMEHTLTDFVYDNYKEINDLRR